MRRSRQTAACCISSLNPSWSEIASASEANAARALSLSPSVMRRSKLPSRQRGVLICVNVRSAAATDREVRRVGTGWKKLGASHRESLTNMFITHSSVESRVDPLVRHIGGHLQGSARSMEEQDGEPESLRPALNSATGPPEGGSGAKSPSNAATRGSLGRSGRAVRPGPAVPCGLL